MQPISAFFTFKLDHTMTMDLKSDLYEHILHCDVEFFEKYKSGELVAMFNRSLNKVKNTATGSTVVNPIKKLIRTIGNIVLLFTLSWKISLIILLIVPFYVILEEYYKVL